MGSAKTLESPVSSSLTSESSGRRGRKRSRSNDNEGKTAAANKNTKESKESKPSGPNNTGKRHKKAAANPQLKENPVSSGEDSSKINIKQLKTVNDELLALRLTSGEGDASSCQIFRRLTNFTIQDGSGDVLPLELVEHIGKDMRMSGTIYSLEDDKENHRVECTGFSGISACKISGYNDGNPVIVISTDLAEYKCIKPSTKYKKLFNHFFEKACACVEIYKLLLKSVEGNSDLSLDELLAGVVRSLRGNYPLVGVYSREFLISIGEFIVHQISDIEESQSIGKKSSDFPVLISLREESRNREGFASAALTSNSGIKINDAVKKKEDDSNFVKIWQEIEYWNSVRTQRKTNTACSSSNAVYIKINEDEFADDYPLPSYYKHNEEEIDEYIAMECEDIMHPDDLPKRMLHNWALYNSDSRLISLELLPMKPCERIDVTIFGSGSITEDDGSGFCIDNDPERSSTGDSMVDSGLPIFLSDIKEWVIELGPSMVFVTIRTDMAWYRLGKPSKQYAPWYKPVLKTAKVAMKIISLLKEESRVSKLSFSDVMKKLLELEKTDALFCSNNVDAIERFVVVHGQIILQLFAEFPDKQIKTCAFLQTLKGKMEYRHHTKWVLNKRNILLKNHANLNPRALMPTAPTSSKRKAMEATITQLIKRIWGEFYSNHSPEEANKEPNCPVKEEDEADDQDVNEDDDNEVEPDNTAEVHRSNGNNKSPNVSRHSNTKLSSNEVRWDGKSTSKTGNGEKVYKRAFVNGLEISAGQSVALESNHSEAGSVFFVEYLFERSDGRKHFHGRKIIKGNETVLSDAANELEYFLTNECEDVELAEIKQTVSVEICKDPWGYQHRKSSIKAERDRREKAAQLKKNGLPLEYFCKSVYAPQMGAFLTLPHETLGLGSGSCCLCRKAKDEDDRNSFHLDSSGNLFRYNGTEYRVHDFVYLSPFNFDGSADVAGTFKAGRNVGSRAYVIGQIIDVIPAKHCKPDSDSTQIKIRRFFRPEDISSEKAYSSDVREIYYSDETHLFPVEEIEGKCEVRRKSDVGPCDSPALFDHVFYCECVYDPQKGSVKQLPASIKLAYSTSSTCNADVARKKKGKGKVGEDEANIDTDAKKSALATLDIFAGCGGLSEGLQQAGIASSKWAIELEEPAGEAFKLNHPDSTIFTNNCNVILRAIMDKCGDSDDCISTKEAAELAASLDQKLIAYLPLPGQVEFISGGPPCQGFSGMNRFNQSAWSKVQCEMILAFLSFADYFRPRYFLLENVRNFVSFNKGHTFRLTLASLLEMGYQVRFGILEAGAFGIAQSRKRAFIWAASPDETLPEWPEPMHVFAVPELKIALSGNSHYAAVRSTAGGAPFRAITVRDTIGDLPSVGNGASNNTLAYGSEPTSWFQKKIRGFTNVLIDHISKEMNELNLIRCKKIPKRPGSDWHDLPDEKITLSTGQVVDLIPWCLPNTAKRHNEWKGLYGRLDWEGNFPTSITDPQPMGKVGMCFHPDQDRIVTVRECARSQGFPDCYKFAGTIHHKHRQIGNAVPPPLAYALGVKLKKAVEGKYRK